MTPAQLAAVHAAAFVSERAWTSDEFDALLQSPHTALLYRPHGFALVRTVAGESELLTLAVEPTHQGQGIGRALVREWIDQLPGRAQSALLDVAADNQAALHVYRTEGFAETGRRAGYYQRKNAASVDAILMCRTVTHGQAPNSAPKSPESG